VPGSPGAAAPADKADWRTSATAIGSIVSVLLVAVGLFYTNDANRKQQQLALQGQVADRFSTAIGQVGQEGKDKLSIRLGGIYALQRLMRDSADNEPAVVKVLCAFVNTQAPRPQGIPTKAVPSSAPADVRAAVAVLGRRPQPDSYQLDFSNSLLGLDHADLSEANLSGVILGRADLYGADLRGANLSRAILNFADLTAADLHGANLSRAFLTGANLLSADLSEANLHGASLWAANLAEANFHGADLREAQVQPGQLDYALVDERTKLPEGVAVPAPSPTQ
jgi:hypothetical protein